MTEMIQQSAMSITKQAKKQQARISIACKSPMMKKRGEMTGNKIARDRIEYAHYVGPIIGLP